MDSKRLEPFRLAPWFSERPWGRTDLKPWYESTGKQGPVGEAWLTGPECVVETGPLQGERLSEAVAEYGREVVGGDGAEFPLLVKLLFPNDKLSVQVHPDDGHAQRMGQPRGKTECWYVLEAEPSATIALGMKDGATAESVRAAIAGGTLEDLLRWVPVSIGDMIFVDAGTVHAIGPGVVLLETQQTCDITFRMYDYGRPRELHVDKAIEVMRTQTAAGKVPPRKMDRFTRLIEQQYFTVDRYDLEPGCDVVIPIACAGCVVGLGGTAVVQCDGGDAVELPAGQAVVVPTACGNVKVRSEAGATLARCFAPNG